MGLETPENTRGKKIPVVETPAIVSWCMKTSSVSVQVRLILRELLLRTKYISCTLFPNKLVANADLTQCSPEQVVTKGERRPSLFTKLHI